MKALIVDKVRSEAGQQAGAMELRRWPEGHDEPGVAGIAFRCPCGCGEDSWLPVNRPGGESRGWTWDGNLEAPTLAPSVFQSGLPCQWHGYLIAGEWVLA